MIVSDFVNELATKTRRDPREIERYARCLREAGMFPERTGGRKVPISPDQAATLLLAVMAAGNAAGAADAVKAYSSLAAEGGTTTKTLLGFLADILGNAHSDTKLRRAANVGTLSILRDTPSAIFTSARPVGNVMFRAPGFGAAPEIATQSHVGGHILSRLSFSIADLPQPPHLA